MILMMLSHINDKMMLNYSENNNDDLYKKTDNSICKLK